MKPSFIALAAVGALSLTAAFADDLKSGKPLAPATLAYPVTLDRTDAAKLIGHAVENPAGDKVGDIEGLHIGKSGKVDDVILGVGGFLGIGQRDVAVKWTSLKIVNDASQPDTINKIVLNATRDQLKSMVAYSFDRPDERRTVFDTPY